MIFLAVCAEEKHRREKKTTVSCKFQNTKERDYVVKAGEGKVYIYTENEIAPPEPPQPKTYNLYGEYE